MTQAIDTQANPTATPVRSVGRNEPCPCGSGNKYKRCCELLVFRGKPGLIVSPVEWEPLPEGVTAPNIVYSSLACEVSRGDISVAIAIWRHATDPAWTLAIQNDQNGMRLWDEPFATELAALEEALKAIQTQGIETFAVNSFD